MTPCNHAVPDFGLTMSDHLGDFGPKLKRVSCPEICHSLFKRAAFGEGFANEAGHLRRYKSLT
jgi:hypothetical protein